VRFTTARDALVAALAGSDGFPMPTPEEFADRVLEQLKSRDWDVRPAISIGFQPAVDAQGGIPWVWVPSGAIAWTSSANNPPTDGGHWALLYVQTKDGEPVQ
jgi:hypothetical protein